MTTPTQPPVQPVIEQIQAADLPKLARRLQSVAYSHGMDDQSPYKTDSFYAKADKKSTDALAELLAAIASKEAEVVRLREALQDIADDTDPDNGKNYRADDREGCLDATFAGASAALNQNQGEPK